MLFNIGLNGARRTQHLLLRYFQRQHFRHLSLTCRHQKTFFINSRKSNYTIPSFRFTSSISKDVDTKVENLIKSLKETKQDVIYLLQSCGKLLEKENPNFRAKLCENIWEDAKMNVDKLQLAHHHAYIQICTENEVLLNGVHILKTIDYEPTVETYRLLIDNNCTLGNVDGAYDLLTDMKYKKYAIDKNIFDSLVLGHTLNSGVKGGEEVINTMVDAQLNVDVNTYWKILVGLSSRNDQLEFEEYLDKHTWEIDDNHFLDTLLRLGLANNERWLSKLIEHINIDGISRYLKIEIERVCVQLICRGHPEAATFIYLQLVDHTMDENYGTFLMEMMLNQRIDINKIVEIGEQIIVKNSFIFENVLPYAFQNKLIDEAWKLLEKLQVLRPHYFWPLLLIEGNNHGENGVFEVFKRMSKLNVIADSDTLEYYCLTYCDKSNPKHLIRKFEPYNVNLKLLVSSLMNTLLKDGQIESAAKVCDHYDVILYSEKMLKVLGNIWFNTKSVDAVIKILQKICESNPNHLDATGVFILKIVKLCNSSETMDDLLKLLKVIESKKLRISSGSQDNILNILQHRSRNFNVPQEIETILENMLDVVMAQDAAHIKHPRDMNVEELENHLIELESKNMETRGLLRRLIIEHCRLGNSNRVNELRDKFISNGYKETAGIRGVMLHTYLENDHLNQALEVYDEIKTKYPHFNIDDFKIVNLASLLIKNDKFDNAMHIIQRESDSKLIKGGKAIERNCWKLLSTIEEPIRLTETFDLLIKLGYCKPSNIILGPLVKVHLRRHDLDTAVKEYKRIANKYNVTPLQLELMLGIVKNERKDLLEECIKVTSKVHGAIRTRVTLLAAFAESELQAPIRKLLLETERLPANELNKRYERWIVEDKLYALQTLLNAARKLPPDVINMNDVYLAMAKIFSMRNDCDAAVKFWLDIVENEEFMADEVHHQIVSLFDRCKYELPEDLLKH